MIIFKQQVDSAPALRVIITVKCRTKGSPNGRSAILIYTITYDLPVFFSVGLLDEQTEFERSLVPATVL